MIFTNLIQTIWDYALWIGGAFGGLWLLYIGVSVLIGFFGGED